MIGGLLYCFFVGKSRLPGNVVGRFFQKDGSWVIHREKIENIKFLADWCFRLGEARYNRELRAVGTT